MAIESWQKQGSIVCVVMLIQGIRSSDTYCWHAPVDTFATFSQYHQQQQEQQLLYFSLSLSLSYCLIFAYNYFSLASRLFSLLLSFSPGLSFSSFCSQCFLWENNELIIFYAIDSRLRHLQSLFSEPYTQQQGSCYNYWLSFDTILLNLL